MVNIKFSFCQLGKFYDHLIDKYANWKPSERNYLKNIWNIW